MTQSSGDRKDGLQEVTIPPGRPPAEEFGPLASVFRRRLLTGLGSASLVAVGANFAGITSSLLGFSPETGRNLKLDVLYPIRGYSRVHIPCEMGWGSDPFVSSRGQGGAGEITGSTSLNITKSSDRHRRSISEPVVAFGPPGSTGELNVSVIVSPVSLDFSIEAFGGPREVGEAVVRTITGSGQRPDVKGTLIGSKLREDTIKNVKYYELEFRVESPSFRRHNIAVCCTRGGKLFTLNAQAPESKWPEVKLDFYTIADSFSLAS
ncbi:PsbP domain-containing protein 7, chloroplastic [Vitis vinifera]|uniref:PsbP domain-containing protein 7, chloroplastic n=1 Tax=Vitis vinifera TaxID=29760 RepID=A0A438CAH3_VITVI|nr:PsbP domain-containing protein 7, chloroplastic [Vitis vinifera]